MTTVAISPTVDTNPDGDRFRINRAYVAAAEGAGLIPFVAAPLSDPRKAAQVLEGACGLILTGGIDVDPALYGEKPHPATQEPSVLRDTWELALFAAARERSIPTLAICRGLQVVNVALGGSLFQDIPTQCTSALVHNTSGMRKQRVHAVEIAPDSRLAAALGSVHITANSMHHQGAARVPDALRTVATSPDGLIEGLEWGGADWWMLAVQWHPEELVSSPEPWDRNLFSVFAAEARAYEQSLRLTQPSG